MKCRQTLNAMVEMLQQTASTAGGDEVCSAVSKALGGAHVCFADSGGHIAGDSGGTAEPIGGEVEWQRGNTLAPRTLASLWAGVAGDSGGASAAAVAINGDWYAVAPVTVLRETLGLLAIRLTREPSRDELDMLGPLATAAGAVLALKYRREEDEHERSCRAARFAIQSLSYSEIIAVRAILEALDGDQGFLVASRIADDTGMTRSVLVNALRKLSSANLVRTRSLGMKGTFVKLLNPELRTEIEGTGLGRESLPTARPGAAHISGDGEAGARSHLGPDRRVVHA